MNKETDVVITWVNGYDSCHQEKLAAYCLKEGIERPLSAAPTRFNQCGELKYCLLSLMHFAPWVRTIYLVTDEKTSAITQDLNPTFAAKIKCIRHQEIFSGYEQYLPTFNSLTIESMLA